VRYARPWLPIVRSHRPQQNMSPLFRPSAATPSFDPPARHRKPVAIAHRQLPIVLITLARHPETTAIRFRLIPTRTGQPTRDPAPDKQPSRSTPPSIATTIPRPLTIRQPGKPPPRFSHHGHWTTLSPITRTNPRASTDSVEDATDTWRGATTQFATLELHTTRYPPGTPTLHRTI
jgi:hypothetical protein